MSYHSQIRCIVLLVIGAFGSTLFVFCVARFVACDRPVSGHNRLVFFEDFSDHSYSCFLPLTKSRLIIVISFPSLEQSRVILSFVFEGQARQVHCIVICINSAPT